LEEIVIPANVKAIFPFAFGWNKKLKKVKFMSDETVVLPKAFIFCDQIDLNAIYKAHPLGDRIFGADEVRYDGDTLTYIPPYYCGKLVVKDGTRKIASEINNLNQFYGITELYLPDSLEYNGEYPEILKVLHASDKTTELNLSHLSNLHSIKWPKNVTKIVADWLDDIENLEIPDSVTEISGFAHMSLLKSMSIPDSVTKIDEDSFRFLPMLTSIKIPSKIKRIENGCFSNTGVKHIDLPSGLKEIGNGAFSDNTSLEEIIIPASVEIIEEDAFSGCTSLKKITIEGDPIIRKGAFHNCPGW